MHLEADENEVDSTIEIWARAPKSKIYEFLLYSYPNIQTATVHQSNPERQTLKPDF